MDLLLKQIGTGKWYVSDATATARAFAKDGTVADVIADFCSLGNYGKCPQNEERDLHVWLKQFKGSNLAPFYFEVVLLPKLKVQPEPVQVPAIIPWELLYHLKKHGQWQASVAGNNPDSFSTFWNGAATQPWGKRHPVITRNMDRTKVVPMQWHFDGGEFKTNQELNLWEWSSTETTGSTLRTKMVFCAIPSEMMPTLELKLSVHATVCNFIAEIHEVLLSGRFPERIANTPLQGWRSTMMNLEFADGFSAGFAGAKFDAKAKKESNNYKHFYNAGFICNECFAAKTTKKTPGALLYSDCSDNAVWKLTTITHEAYLKITDPANLSPWIKVPGWHLTRGGLRDLLHCFWLGFAKDLAAAVIIQALEEGLLGNPGETCDETLRRLWLEQRDFCKKHKLDCPPRVFSMTALGRGTSSREYPIVESQVKGAQMKPMMFFLAELTRKQDVPGCTPQAQYRSVCMYGACEFIYTLESETRWMNPENARRAWRGGRLMLQTYQVLAADALRQNRCLYKIRPKLHDVAHIVEHLASAGAVENPLFWQNFNEEDFIGKITDIAGSCNIRTAMLRCLQRYLIELMSSWDKVED